MRVTRLRTFIVLSLVLHIILLTALVAILLPNRTIIKNSLHPISFGILPQNNTLDDSKDNTSDLIPLNISKQNETPENNTLEKMKMSQTDDNEKTIRKIGHQEGKTSVKKIIKNKITVSSESDPREAETANKNLAFKKTDKSKNNATTRILISNDEMDPGIDNGTSSQTQNIERAFPDYKINPKPTYPTIARRRGYEGSVLVRVWVLESGSVGKIELEESSGYRILDKSAVKAIKDWVFTPGKRNGEPIPSWVTVPIKFQLNSG